MIRYKKSFRKAFDFMERHKDTKTHEDWGNVAEEMGVYSENATLFERDMLMAIINEIERTYSQSEVFNNE